MQALENWIVSKVTVNLKNGLTIEGKAAQLFVNTAGDPVALQVSKEDHKITIPWGSIDNFTHV